MLLAVTGYIIYKKELSLLQIIGFSTIIGGGFSNVFDRLINSGMVVDFMNFGIGTLRTGILNFADLSVTIGGVIIVISFLVQKKTTPK